MTSRAFTTGTGRHSPSFAFSLSLILSLFSFSIWLFGSLFFLSFLRGGLSLLSIYILQFVLLSIHSTLFFPHFSYSLTSILCLSLSLSTPHPPSLPPWPQGRTADRLCTPAAQGLFLRSICPSPSLWRLTQPNNISSAHTHMCAQTHTGISTCTH